MKGKSTVAKKTSNTSACFVGEKNARPIKGTGLKVSPPKVPTPRAYHNATYGENSLNPLFWDLINATTHLKTSRAIHPKANLLVSLVDRAKGLGVESVHGGILLGFFEAAAEAILRRDSDFFRETARLLESVGSPPYRRIDLAVLRAHARLRALGRMVEPTKRQVRKAALEVFATENVFGRRRFRGVTALYAPVAAAELRKEVDRIPRQNWTKIFKRCELEYLPADKGGQPSHSRVRSTG